MVKYIKSSTFNRLMSHMNEFECMFITAFRSAYSRKENIRRNKQLVGDLNHWDFSYVKTLGGYTENKGSDDEVDVVEYSYCVINDKYTTEKFIEIAVMLCKKYEQDAVLVTFPIPKESRTTRSKQNTIRVDGKYYDKNGNIVKEFNGVTVQNITEYFTRVGNRKFTLYSEGKENITESIDVYGVAGRQISNDKFYQRKKSFSMDI